MGGQHKDSEGAQNGFFEMDKILNVPEGTASVVDVHAALDPIVLVGIVTSCGDQQGSPVPKDVAKAPASQVISIWWFIIDDPLKRKIKQLNKQFFYSKCEKSGSQKQEKWENGQKQPILGMFWCFWVTKSVSPQLRPGSKVVFFTIFADYEGWEAEKSRNRAQ